jgi:protein SCO1/2
MHGSQSIFPWLGLTITILTTACRPAEEARRYELHGQILAVRPESREVLIKHDDIKNFMPGMTMPFRVRDARMLDGKSPGDLVTARLMVGANEAWLATLDKTGVGPLDAPATIPPAAFVRPLQPGDAIPDTTLTDQDGQPVSIAQWRDKAVVVTFIYVRCPLPEFCPLMDRRFVELQRAIRADDQLARRVRLLSVSFDPDQDTPGALTSHASQVGADSAIWRFATAPRDVVDRFAASFGVNVIREADGTITHNLRTAVIDLHGRLVRIHDSTQWTAAQILDDLERTVTR